MNEPSGKSVCVVGAGIAGLVTAKVMQDDGFRVTVFDRQAAPGGVWTAARTYPGLRANNSADSYAFSDFPYPPGTDDYPTAEQVRAYLEAYTDRFGIRPSLRLSTEVVSVSRAPGSGESHGGFHVTVRPVDGSAPQATMDFDFVVVCNGVFSEPQRPEIPGRERFEGPVLHSSEFVDSSVAAGRDVVVVGAGKSALDCAAWAAEHARSCTLVFRAPHWMVPRYFPGGKRADEVLLSRFSELLLPPYHRPGRAEAILHTRGAPLVRFWWRVQNRLMTRLLRMPPSLLPEIPLPSGFENIGVGNDFYQALDQGRLTPKRARVASFSGATEVELDTGERIPADVVILATGWRQSIPFLDDELRGLVFRDGAFQLYRHILPPRETRLGFVGYASSVACQLTSEIAAHWLAQCFLGELPLPSASEMESEIVRVREWMTRTFPARPEGYFVGPYLAHYLDDLLVDMAVPTRRMGSLVAEYMSPFTATRFRDLPAERRHARVRAERLPLGDRPVPLEPPMAV